MDGTNLLMRIYSTLQAHFGPQHWWPAESPFEVAVGAVLTQNTAWRNVEMALSNLRSRGALNPGAMWAMPVDELETCLRPSGFYRLKAKRLRNLLAYFITFPDWDRSPDNLSLRFLQETKTDDLRAGLLGITGIGPETADCLLLYALNRPSFVADAYARRIFNRHGFVASNINAEELRSFFMCGLDRDAALFNEYHALIVCTGKAFCKKSKPLCHLCPLGDLPRHVPD